MDANRFNVLRLLACICLGSMLLAACGAPGEVSGARPKNCDPTGNAEARQACNR